VTLEPTPPLPAPVLRRRTRLLGIVLLLATFVAGGLVGAAVDRMLLGSHPRGHFPWGPFPIGMGPGPGGERRIILFDELDLTPEQDERIHHILERRREQMRDFWKRTGPSMRAVMDSTDQEIRAVLTPAQRERLDQLRKQHKLRFRKWRDRGPPSQSRGAKPPDRPGGP